MGAYHYQALNQLGNNLKGIIEADSERHARQLLRDQGMFPTEIRIQSKQQKLRPKDKLSTQDLSLLTRQLATLLTAGIPVEEALRGVSEQTEKEKVRELIIGVRSKVTEGYGLAQAMGEFPNAFSELYRATVGAGEQTGRLDIVLEKLADYVEQQQKTKQKIQQALIYPSLMILVSLSIISFLLAFVIPKITQVFSNTGQALPQATQILISISHFIRAYSLTAIITLVIAGLAFKKSLSNLKIRNAWDRILLKLPIVAYLLRSTNVARYIHTFSILFGAGVSILETMRVSASLITNLEMKKAFNTATIHVREGSAISSALKETHYLTPMAVHLVASGEKSGQISEMMERVSSHLDNEVKRLIDSSLTLLEPLVILFMGVVILFIVLATLLPIFSMDQLVN